MNEHWSTLKPQGRIALINMRVLWRRTWIRYLFFTTTLCGLTVSGDKPSLNLISSQPGIKLLLTFSDVNGNLALSVRDHTGFGSRYCRTCGEQVRGNACQTEITTVTCLSARPSHRAAHCCSSRARNGDLCDSVVCHVCSITYPSTH